MNTIAESEFLERVKALGIELDPRYPKMSSPGFGGVEATANWEFPAEAHRRPYFLSSILGLLGGWNRCYAWRDMGSWPGACEINPHRLNDQVEFQILSGLGLPMGTSDVIQFVASERVALITLMLTTTIFGWARIHDLYLIPDDASAIIFLSHHDSARVSFRNARARQLAIEQMALAGFHIPE